MTILYTNFLPVSLTIAEFATYESIQASIGDATTPVELRLLDAGKINFQTRLDGLAASILGTIGADRIAGGDGADTISGGEGRDVLFGLDGADSLLGGLGVDQLSGGSGRDTMDGGEGADEMRGSSGDDWYFTDNANDIVIEALGEGIDTVFTVLGKIRLVENVENLTFQGTGRFIASGNSLDNEIRGGGGADRILGLGGNDTIYGNADDTLVGGRGNDTYHMTDSANPFIIEAIGAGIDTLYSDRDINAPIAGVENFIATGSDNARLTGNELNNILVGTPFFDLLIGGTGSDTMTGGLSGDMFMFYDFDSVDVITDFKEGVDDIMLFADVFSAAPFDGGGPLDPNAFKDLSLGALDASDRIVYNRRTGELFYDADGSGDGAAELFCILRGTVFLTANDIAVTL